MTRLRRIPREMVEEWVQQLPTLYKEFPSKHKGFERSNNQVFMAISNRYGVHVRSVARHLNPILHERNRLKIMRRSYAARHERLRYRIADVLHGVYRDDFELSMDQILERIKDYSGISIHRFSLEQLMRQYEDTPCGKPLLKTGPNIYVLNADFYVSMKKAKAPISSVKECRIIVCKKTI